jgi:hypothetical protein
MTPKEIKQMNKNTARLMRLTVKMQKIQEKPTYTWEEISGVQNVTAEKLKHIPHRADCHWPHHSAVSAIEAYEEAQAQRKEQRQAIDNAHAEVYSVWNGAKRRLYPLELNHLEAALRILAELGYFDSHTGEGAEE